MMEDEGDHPFDDDDAGQNVSLLTSAVPRQLYRVSDPRHQSTETTDPPVRPTIGGYFFQAIAEACEEDERARKERR